jgi:hypothetical protein
MDQFASFTFYLPQLFQFGFGATSLEFPQLLESRVGETRNAYNILIGKPERERQIGRPRRRWEDDIRMDLREREWEIVDWMHLSQDRDHWWAVVNTVKNPRVP